MRALLAVLIGVTVTSWGAILVRLAAVPALGAAFYRMAFAAAILAPLSFFARPGAHAGAGGAASAARGVPRQRAGQGAAPPGRRSIALMLLSGACLALHFATWIASLSYTSIASSVVLVSTVPIFGLAMSAIFLGERAGAGSVAAILVAFGGAAAIGSGDYGAGGGRLGGDLLALAGAFFAAAYLLIGRHLRAEVPLLRYLVRVYGAAAILLMAMALAAGAALGPYPADSFLWLFLMALGPSLVGHGLLNYAVRHMRAYVVNAAGLGEPALATVWAFAIFGERPGASLYAGGALVAAGLIAVLMLERRRLATRA